MFWKIKMESKRHLRDYVNKQASQVAEATPALEPRAPNSRWRFQGIKTNAIKKKRKKKKLSGKGQNIGVEVKRTIFYYKQ